MKDLIFYGPYHFDDVIPSTGKLEKNSKSKLSGFPDPNVPGIYIWGFMYSVENTILLEPVDFNIQPNHQALQFIPFYVGKSKRNSYKDRLSKHHDVRNKLGNSDADKYIRLSDHYLKEFFKCALYPVKTRGKSATITKMLKLLEEQKPGSIEYHNNIDILCCLHNGMDKPNKRGDDHPITFQKMRNGSLLKDTLDIIITQKNNFWFYFCPIDNYDISEIRNMETHTFYSLKGKTESWTEKHPQYPEYLCKDFTGRANIFKGQISNNFPGYL